MTNRLLYFAPYNTGGLGDYAHAQGNALASLGTDVTFLCPREHQPAGPHAYRLLPVLAKPTTGARSSQPAFVRRSRYVTTLLGNVSQLARHVVQGGFSRVLLVSYFEYLAPIWAPVLRRLAARGVVFGAVVHDPVRDYVVGPLWWHRRSVAAGYSYLRDAFVHAPITLDTVRPMARLCTTVIPHGPYAFPPALADRDEARRNLNLPPGAPTLLSFGHIRDGKNLDLVLRAMAKFPELHLVVAGQEQSAGQKPAAFYQELARREGVADRCRWLVRHVPAEEVGGLFAAADLTLLTYSAAFRSASGVLNTAVAHRLPCIASGGEGSLQQSVQRYGLGVWIEPDRLDTLCDGLHSWFEHGMLTPRWEEYARENSWRRNAELVRERLFST